MIKSQIKSKTIKNFILILAILLVQINFAQNEDSGLASISRDDLIQSVSILCSVEFDGRLPGSEGFNKAADFASEKFEKAGLIPAGDENFFQYLNVEHNKIDSPVVFNLITPKQTIACQPGKDFVLRGFTGSGDISLPVAFCGYGISRPDLGYDDYENIDVKDKIVIVFKQNPTWKIYDSTWEKEYPREKSRVAFEHGAKGILFVSRPNDSRPQPLIGSVMHGEGEQLLDFPQLQISIEAANDLLLASELSIKECQTKIDESKTPFSFVTDSEAEIFVKTKYERSAKTTNVVGLLEGSDKELKDEYLIIGAHLDHVGSQAGLLFPGANDNASGSAGVIEIVEAFQASKIKPKRSILFVLFASEEQGLLGSKYFVKNMNIHPEKVVAMFNLDCIGYGDSIQVGNGKSSPDLWSLANGMDQENFNLMVTDTWGGGGADLTPFYEAGIPALYFVSKYGYDHLHLSSDVPETLNSELYEKTVKLVYLTALEVAN